MKILRHIAQAVAACSFFLLPYILYRMTNSDKLDDFLSYSFLLWLDLALFSLAVLFAAMKFDDDEN